MGNRPNPQAIRLPSSDPRPRGSDWHSPPKLHTPAALWATRQIGTQEGSGSAAPIPRADLSAGLLCTLSYVSNARNVLGLHFYARHCIMSPFKQEQYMMLQFSYFKGEVTSIMGPLNLRAAAFQTPLVQVRSRLG